MAKGMCPECKRAYAEGEAMGEKKEGRHIKRRNEKITKVMGEFEHGELHSGSKQGPVVKNRKQALAIGYSEARKKRAKKKKK